MRDRTLLLALSTLFAGSLLAQPTLTTSNAIPPVGDYPVSTGGLFADPGPGGADQSFGYWMIPPTGNRTYRYLAPSVTPSSASVPGTTVLSTDGGSDTLFWGTGANGLELKGERSSLSTAVIVYTDPGVELKLPLAYNDTWTDNLNASYTVSGFPVTRTGSIAGAADAWGDLELPDSLVENVLRVNVRKETLDQAAITSIHRVQHITYFYNGDMAYPSLKLTVDTTIIGSGNPAVTRSAEWLFGPGTVGMEELSFDDVRFTAYPNPAVGNVDIRLAGQGRVRTIELLNGLGQVVRAQQPTATGDAIQGAFDVSGLDKGLYHVRITFADGTCRAQPLLVQ